MNRFAGIACFLLIGLTSCCLPALLPVDVAATVEDDRFRKPEASQRLSDAFEALSTIDPITTIGGCWGRIDIGSFGGNSSVYTIDLDAMRARSVSAPINSELDWAIQIEEFDIEHLSENRISLVFKRFIGWHPFLCDYVDRQSTMNRREDWIVLKDGEKMALVVVAPEYSIEDVISFDLNVNDYVYLRFDCRIDEIFGSPID